MIVSPDFPTSLMMESRDGVRGSLCKPNIIRFIIHVLGVTPESRVKFVHSEGMYPWSLATDRSKATV